MSTHAISASGQRYLSMNVNGPDQTGATIQAREGDSATFSGNSFDHCRVLVPLTAKLTRFLIPFERDGEKGVDEYVEIDLGTSVSLRMEVGPREEGSHPPTPHTSLFVKRQLDENYWKARASNPGGEVIEAGTLGELLSEA